MAGTARVDEFSLPGSCGTMPSVRCASTCDILTTLEPKGLSRQASLAALAGMVMHRTIARIIRALADSGVDSVQDPRSVSVLKSLGGYSKVIAESVADVSKSLTGNPRFELVRSSSLARLNNRLPAIREQVQLQLSRLKWKLQPPPIDLTDDFDTDAVARDRPPLEQGTHFEVELRHPGIKWRGFADLIELRDDLCTIEDFKSGEPSDDHLLQLQIYALLWCHDEELNPAKTAVDKLVICYPNGDRIVPYNKKERRQVGAGVAGQNECCPQSSIGA